MNSKEKAEQLVRKYVYELEKTDSCLSEKCESIISCQLSWYHCEGWLKYAKQCALIFIDEIIKVEKNHMHHKWVNYWEEVKIEIEKL